MQPFVLGAGIVRAGPLLLDQPTRDDVDAITRYCQDPVFEEFMTLPWPYRRRDAEFFVDDYVPRGWESGTEVTWALRINGEFLGVVGVRKAIGMIGFWLGAEHRGHGHMPRAVTAVADWAFSSGWLDSIRWEAVVGNRASLAVARKTGFRYTGVEPAHVVGRDGSHPDSRQAILQASDDREQKPGWPDA